MRNVSRQTLSSTNTNRLRRMMTTRLSMYIYVNATERRRLFPKAFQRKSGTRRSQT